MLWFDCLRVQDTHILRMLRVSFHLGDHGTDTLWVGAYPALELPEGNAFLEHLVDLLQRAARQFWQAEIPPDDTKHAKGAVDEAHLGTQVGVLLLKEVWVGVGHEKVAHEADKVGHERRFVSQTHVRDLGSRHGRNATKGHDVEEPIRGGAADDAVRPRAVDVGASEPSYGEEECGHEGARHEIDGPAANTIDAGKDHNRASNRNGIGDHSVDERIQPVEALHEESSVL